MIKLTNPTDAIWNLIKSKVHPLFHKDWDQIEGNT